MRCTRAQQSRKQRARSEINQRIGSQGDRELSGLPIVQDAGHGKLWEQDRHKKGQQQERHEGIEQTRAAPGRKGAESTLSARERGRPRLTRRDRESGALTNNSPATVMYVAVSVKMAVNAVGSHRRPLAHDEKCQQTDPAKEPLPAHGQPDVRATVVRIESELCDGPLLADISGRKAEEHDQGERHHVSGSSNGMTLPAAVMKLKKVIIPPKAIAITKSAERDWNVVLRAWLPIARAINEKHSAVIKSMTSEKVTWTMSKPGKSAVNAMKGAIAQ